MCTEIFKNLKVLFVEDEVIIREKVVSSLKYIVSEVVSASNGLEALEILQTFEADLIITDLEMPYLNGVELIKEIRKRNDNICIMVVTAYTSEKFLLELIDMHIEKYILKPINLEKLIEALEFSEKAILKSTTSNRTLPNGYTYDWNKKILFHENELISLTKKEILFLELLFGNINTITTYCELQKEVWEDSIMTDNALRSLVRNLRKKLPKDFVINLSGMGYKIA